MFPKTIAAFGGALAFAAGALATTASAGSFTRGCAARDIQLLTMIEEREGANAISPPRACSNTAAASGSGVCTGSFKSAECR